MAKLEERGVSVELLHQMLTLDAETGRLWWKPRPVEMFNGSVKRTAEVTARSWNRRHAGAEALAALHSAGYRGGSIFCRRFFAHRVVFALHNGRWPDDQVDHIDGDRLNNRPGNLREATNAENLRNRGPTRTSSSRFCGVSWCTSGGIWRAQCRDAAGAVRYLGRFTDEIEAARAYDAFARKQHGDFAKLNFPEETDR